MTLANIQLSLLIGQLMPLPAPAELMRALQSVSINQSYDGPGGFQIVFRAERGAAPFAGPHTIIRTESTPPPDRLQLQLGPDNRGRLALTATLLF